jgi:L-rhamnose mutarotase
MSTEDAGSTGSPSAPTTGATRRVGQVIGLADGALEEYARLHADVWPGVLDTLRRAHIRNYSIYRHGDLLFSYFEYTGDDYEADLATIAADPVTQEWWRHTDPLQRTLRERPEDPWWTPMEELFHLD